MEPNSRVVIVTGAGQGIGAKYAHEFAAQGDKVVAADINQVAVEKVAAEIQSAGQEAIGLPVDVSDQGSVSKLVSQTVEHYGTVHVLINNAAIFSSLKMKPFEEISVDEWEKVFAVNTRGVLLMCQAVAPYMKEQRFGRIVNISSSVVVTGRANYAHYVASKGAVQAFNKALATELGDYEVTANVVSPHGIVTEIPRETITDDNWKELLKEHAIKRKGTPEDVLSAVRFFASNEAGYITGQSLLVDAGLRYT
ncbi:SDR family NAD(P)-dependent oxidoreductase [Nesterenkonia ebinurensis]|uniref:SDR family NAD(P)-dependent oxidoreductase n=1 Tax=Nesterenkonia ebinurensis TaxID=2608252 RepID=UPI00123CD24B|nr:SDR family NAD(P)-dependent oxidoreductase [Nesterenkonia ebinurensis]